MKGKLLAIGMLALGAALGAYANSCISQPRIAVQALAPRIAGVSLDALANSREKANVPSQVINLTAGTAWVNDIEDGATLGEYVSALLRARITLREAQDKMAKLRIAMNAWPRQPYNEAALDNIYGIVRSNSLIICAHLFGETRRGVTVFRSTPTRLLKTPRFRISPDQDGDLHLGNGIQNIPIVWSDIATRAGSSAEKLKAVAERLAESIAYGDAAGLQELHAELENCLREQATIERLLPILESEIAGYSRWIVPVLITNGGKDPASVAGEGRLYINGRGAIVSEAGGAKEYKDDVAINIERVKAVSDGSDIEQQLVLSGLREHISLTQRSREPVIVSGGAAIIVEYETVDNIGKIDAREPLMQWFKGGERRFRVAVGVITGHPGRAWSRPFQMSPSRVFREFEAKKIYPDKAF